MHLEFCQATVSAFKPIVHIHILTGKIYPISIQLAINQPVHPVSFLRKSISGRHRPVRVADGPMTARYRFK